MTIRTSPDTFRHRRQRRSGEPLWTIRVNHVTYSAELNFHGESYGWEAQIFRETDFTIGRRFILRAEAVGWAEAERKDLEKDRL